MNEIIIDRGVDSPNEAQAERFQAESNVRVVKDEAEARYNHTDGTTKSNNRPSD
jgi:hypothetical protein